jgi:deoxyribodipyrimidine photo-lyase
MAAAVTLFWFRRDLRFTDNHGLSQALAAGLPVVPIFIFDREILSLLSSDDARVTFIHDAITALDSELRERGSGLSVYSGKPAEVFAKIFKEHKVAAVYCNEDCEPYARARDEEFAALAAASGAEFKAFKDQVMFAKSEVAKDNGEPYRIYTPYMRKWKAEFKTQLKSTPPKFNTSKGELAKPLQHKIPSLKDLGFERTQIALPPRSLSKSKIANYAGRRDGLALDATTHLGVHLRFGTLSVREAVRAALANKSEIWLNELIWREFFMQILWHYPHSANEPFDPRYKNVEWINDKKQFQKWCDGQTGYPVVDAGMRELNATGFMHNRARMITGSFLCKHLLIDWRWGERYFAKKLLDFDLAANAGNWQWVAGTGCDAAPYFRVFNPALQAKKFDPDGEYVKRWVPELGTKDYPDPIVDHETARRRALVNYKKGLGK